MVLFLPLWAAFQNAPLLRITECLQSVGTSQVVLGVNKLLLVYFIRLVKWDVTPAVTQTSEIFIYDQSIRIRKAGSLKRKSNFILFLSMALRPHHVTTVPIKNCSPDKLAPKI